MEQDKSNLDLRLQRVDGVWTLSCRALGHEVQGATLDAAARVMQATASDEANLLEGAKATGYLMAEGCKRLSRLQILVDVLTPLATPQK